jgi:uncharacterized glyoxalase superfamily protein PhnB
MVVPSGQFRFVYSPRNYEEADAFYRKGLGLGIDHEWDYGSGDRGVVFCAAAGMIELLGLAPGQEYVKPQGFGIAIEVEDADHWFELAKERGLKIVQEPVTYSWGHRVVRLEDPEGVVVSLFQVVKS